MTRDEIILDQNAPGSSFLVILDANLYPAMLAHGIASIKEQYPQARVVVLSDSFNLDDMKSAFQSGADGYCLATTGCEALIKYLDLVMLGEVVFPSAAFLSAISDTRDQAENKEPLAITVLPAHLPLGLESHDSPIRTLSSRESEILQCLMQGAPNKVIARKLDVAEATVKVHIKAILRKIRVANRTQAAMWAVNHLSGGSEAPLPASSERLAAHGLR
ncbi:LuxR C-terminal-related transcriptional regulator [Microvirga soli]|uniref:LuxR C-terminal-related transcriptional regulator n=1 Tax=Microvirga soli TaxID=1854496 RepID=UPI00191D36A4|nr:response regulator transcription factor [Microvirga soli]